ncbi:MAG: YcaQ family DNA glycosylase [Cyclobacteriaceae bacterium]|nr:YcaQ family DNA glycosylase [Cyclobacteriaceae bacterium SS2]
MTKRELTQLRRAILASQGLHKPNPFGKGKRAVLATVEKLGYIQIDTISVVHRAHHHTLWTRVPDYQEKYLDRLVKERKLFEYWFHAASYLPMRDYRFAIPLMQRFRERQSPYYNVDQKILNHVYDRIKIDGPQKARDFQAPNKKSGGWWEWKPAKVALEKLFMQGELMIAGREGMQKIYDIKERVLPDSIDTSMPDPLEYARYLVETHLRAYGVTNVKQITHLKKGKELRKNVEDILYEMTRNKEVQEINLDGFPSLYAYSDLLEKTKRKTQAGIRLLSPFDNAVIHRDRIEKLFGFDYRIECYTPQPKRQYGYFCLPILFGDEFIGRIDSKAHRKKGELELIHLHIENTKYDIKDWLDPFVESVNRFASFNECTSVSITNVSPGSLKNTIMQAFPK